MIRLLLLCGFMIFNFGLNAQSLESAIQEVHDFQNELNENFKNGETSILLPEDLESFTGLKFYPINLGFRVNAEFVRTPNEVPFLMPTTTDRLPEYVKYAELHFLLEDKVMVLNIYQNLHPKEGYEDYLFLPFTDLTSGNGSYGGGRYIDLFIPEGNKIILDFNKAYNPYCAYNAAYSCPIPPEENDLKIRIEAGVRDFKINRVLFTLPTINQ